MLQLKTVFGGCAIALTLAVVAQAEYLPVSLTSDSYTADLIAENTATTPAAGVSALPFETWTWFESRDGHPEGLPTGGEFTSSCASKAKFKYQSYTSNNGTFIGVGASSTLTLSTPSAFKSLAFLVSSQTGSILNVWSITLNYADGTNSGALTSASDVDWTDSGSGYKALATAVTSPSSWGGGYPSVWMVEHDWDLTAAQQKLVKSITINVISGGGSITFFALSGEAVPEPATSAILLPGVAGLLAFAWRKRRK